MEKYEDHHAPLDFLRSKQLCNPINALENKQVDAPHPKLSE
ncbi:MAG: hypothetical protein RBT11_06855 [Desulfobacterales bacterium]|jgi:hypothetical protein|nr:hypothetical protein [Desulfobacterales bacterium]